MPGSASPPPFEPLTFTDISEAPDWHGNSWALADMNTMAELVSELLLGNHRHVSKIISTLQVVPSTIDLTGKQLAATRARLAATTDTEVYHRDGWLFQMISWIAFRIEYPQFKSMPPHTEEASKGFDGLAISLDDNASTSRRIVFIEDKATDNPRATFESDVVDGIKTIESGAKESELVSKLSVLVERNVSDDAAQESAIQELLSKGTLRTYRVCSAFSKAKAPKTISIYKGYSSHVDGDVERRQGNTLALDSLRTWMENFAKLVDAKLESKQEEQNV